MVFIWEIGKKPIFLVGHCTVGGKNHTHFLFQREGSPFSFGCYSTETKAKNVQVGSFEREFGEHDFILTVYLGFYMYLNEFNIEGN